MDNNVHDLSYQAMEPIFNRIRLASDINHNIYVISDHDIPYSAPYEVVIASRELYRFIDSMEIITLNDVEYTWVNKLNSLVRSLTAEPC